MSNLCAWLSADQGHQPPAAARSTRELIANLALHPKGASHDELVGRDYAWADAHIHRLHATLIGFLERAGHARLGRGDIHGALELADRAIALGQFHEASWRLASTLIDDWSHANRV